MLSISYLKVFLLYCIVNRGYMFEGNYWNYIVNHAATGQHGKDTPSNGLFT
jgi:hypothetical protein